jgi:hypothetical protein
MKYIVRLNQQYDDFVMKQGADVHQYSSWDIKGK